MNYFQTLALVTFIYMNFWFVISLIKKRNDVADIGWGLGFVLLAWTSLFLSGSFNLRGFIVSILVSVWGIRLAWHIYTRNKGNAEDYRYLAWREAWKDWFYIRSYFQVYILQGIFMIVIATPVIVINRETGSPINLLDLIGISVWIFGFVFEAVGDAQLAKHIHNPKNKGKLIQTGLWKYTRHPNYFGEVTLWWGIWIIALSIAHGWISIIGPITITFLILKVSGIPMLEEKMQKKPEFEEYKRKTSSFIPWFRKQSSQ